MIPRKSFDVALFPFNSNRTFIGVDGRKYTWRLRTTTLEVIILPFFQIPLTLEIQLYLQDDITGNEDFLVASYHRKRFIYKPAKGCMKFYTDDYKANLGMFISKPPIEIFSTLSMSDECL